MVKLKPCPFCGGATKFTARQAYFSGFLGDGNKAICWKIRPMCKKCHALGSPVTTDPIPLCKPGSCVENGNWWTTTFAGRSGLADEAFRPYVERAAERWNRRAAND